jgi:DNA repair protein RecO (recombination protein O)
MNIKTRGIVFHHIKYSDTSLIATVFTESSGRKAFLLKGIYRPKSLIKPGFFQPLTLLQMEVTLSAKRELQRIREVAPCPALNNLYGNALKQSVVFFLSEILYKAVREEEPNPALFEFLHHSVLYLDACDADVSNFHLVFLLQLSRFLGFFPLNDYSEANPQFDALNGCFVPETEISEYTFEKRISSRLNTLMNLNFESSSRLLLSRTERVELLELLIEYYGIHLHSRLNIQSLQVLKELYD